MEIDDTYYSSILITNYFREQNDLILKTLIDSNINLNISIFYEKQDTYKTIKQLTYNIGNVGVDVHSNNSNKQDSELAYYAYDDARYIRKEIQINNEELYFLYIYVNIFSNNKNEIEYLLNKVEGILQSQGMQTRRAYFREEAAYLSCLPLMINKEEVKEVSKRNILTNGILATYPFISSSIYDEEGIYIGKNIYNKSLIFIDRYDKEKYKNANMCVFGTSGAGKSYFLKLNILRYRIHNIEQYIIDSEREYTNICNKLDGVLLKIGPTSDTYINILDIREESLEEERGFLASKISKLIGFFNLIFGELDEKEKAILEEKLIELYKNKGITFDDDSLYFVDENGKKTFKNNYMMPILEDFYNLLNENDETKIFKIKLIPFVKGSLKFFNNYTNIKINNKLIIADIYELGEENFKYGMYLFTELFWDKIKKDRKIKKAIYIDEIWRLIGVTSNKEVASFIYKIFKTIRKYGGSAVAATQDISDLFGLEDGIFGKSILNNSSIKSFFALEEENIKILKQYTNISDKEAIDIKSLRRGECLMMVGEDHILAQIDSADYEKNIIE
ncbi:MAG: VirB4 family type IV secretion system protein [Christensenellales bacterium]